jgi:adenylylsulfate kinase-like enzyme
LEHHRDALGGDTVEGQRQKEFGSNLSIDRFIHTVKKLLTRVVQALPESIQDQIRDRYWQIKSTLLYQSLYRVLDLEHTLDSGLTLKVASKGEWWAYNEIFVNGEYDVPICTALKDRSPLRPFVVLDLGANVGYFTFRVLDLIDRQEQGSFSSDITMVEGSPKTFLELEKRVRSGRLVAMGVRMVHGLVGLPRGNGVIREGALHVKNTTVDIPARQGVNVDFVDLNFLMEDKFDEDETSPGRVFWITGLSGAGKTTLGRELWSRLRAAGRQVTFLDGDELRGVIAEDLGHSAPDRRRSAMRNARLCRLLAQQGGDVICATISLFHEVQRWNRENIPGYREIYLRVPIDELRRRDSKGIYARGSARRCT